MKTEFKALPNVEAIDYFRGKGFAPALSRFSWKDVWGEEHSRAFTVAKATRDDVFGALRDSVDRAIAEGRSLKDFKAEMEPVLKSFGWWGRGTVTDPKTGLPEEAQLGSANRLRIIYDTNVRTANSAGRWARAQRNKALMPFFTYIQIDRPSAREAHKPFDGVTLPVDHAFWRTHWAPNGWLCGCMVRQISKRVLKRDGLAVTDEAKVAEISKTRPHRNDRTGEVTDVPIGIDPGFAHNPGIARYNPATGSFDPEAGAPKVPAVPVPVAPTAGPQAPPPQEADPFANVGRGRAEVTDAFSFAPKVLTEAIAAAPRLSSFTHSRNGAVFQRMKSDPGFRKIDMDHHAKGSPEYRAVLRHEYGHALDYGPDPKNARSSSKQALDALDEDGKAILRADKPDAFAAAMKKLEARIDASDIDTVLREEAQRFGFDFDDLVVDLQGSTDFRPRAMVLLAALESRYARIIFGEGGVFPTPRRPDDVAMFHDLIGAATNNLMRLPYGHSDEYYRARGATATRLGAGNGAEGFANWVSIMGGGSKLSRSIFERLAPKTNAAYLSIVADLATLKL